MDFEIKDGCLVKYMGKDAEVVVPEGVTSIGDHAFYWSTNLTSVTIPNGLTWIRDEAFCDCESLTNITIPNSVTSIGRRAFEGCSSLTSVTIPNGVKSIKSGAFESCSNLTSVTIPNGVESIESGAFEGCSSLTNITIPNSVTSIGWGAFKGCSSLTSVTIPNGVKSIGSDTFKGCISLTSVTIPNSVTSIGWGAFEGCSSLTSVAISENMTMDRRAFAGCEGLTDESGLFIARNVLWCVRKDLTDVIIPENVKEIDSSAFKGCASLANVTIPDTVKEIESGALGDCIHLRNIRIPTQFASKLNDYALSVNEETRIHIEDITKVSAKYRLAAVLAFAEDGRDCTDENGKKYLKYIKSAAPKLMDAALKHPALLELMLTQKLIDEKNFDAVMDIAQESRDSSAFMRLQEYGQKTFSQEKLKKAKNRVSHEILKDGKPDPELTERFQAAFVQIQSKEDIEKYIDKGIHWRGTEQLCTRELLRTLISYYANEYDRCAEIESGETSSVRVLKDGLKVQRNELVDEVASLLEKDELLKLLEKKIDSQQYRNYLLAWACFADEQSVEQVTGRLRTHKRGNAKERYQAQNLEEALLLSDTRAAMNYYDKNEMLDRYAQSRGMSAMEMRDNLMMPDFGFDCDGVKRYDIGGNTIEVSVRSDFSLALFDAGKKKEIRSFPKKSAEPEKAEAAAKAFAEFKKEIQRFVKQRSEQLCKMHMSGEAVGLENWRKVYMENPVVRPFAAHLVWADQNGKTFTVFNGKIIDSQQEEYIPQGHVKVAHVLDMTQEEIERWQHTLAEIGQTQLFEQIWEPVFRIEKKNLDKRYQGIKISSAKRNAMKAKLLRSGIRVYSGDAEREYDYREMQWIFEGKNTMHFGHSASLDYWVDEESKDIEFREFQLEEDANPRELNAIIFELERLKIGSLIEQNQADELNEAVLNTFNVAQIGEFIDLATSSNAVDCSAALLAYRNAHYPEYDAMQEFVLDW